MTMLEGLFGLFLGRASSGLIALAAIYYPTAIRSTGVKLGDGHGTSRPVCWPARRRLARGRRAVTVGEFVALGLPALIATVTTVIAGRTHRRRDALKTTASQSREDDEHTPKRRDRRAVIDPPDLTDHKTLGRPLNQSLSLDRQRKIPPPKPIIR